MILGLDVSTTKIGAAVLSDPVEFIKTVNGKSTSYFRRELLMSECWDLDTKIYPDIEDKMEVVMAELSTVRSKYNITEVFIEEHIKGVNRKAGRNNIQILLKLAKFNGLVCWGCYDMFGFKAKTVNPIKARKSYGISFANTVRSPERKKIITKTVIETEGNKFEWSYNRNGVNYATGTEDRADAVVTARYGEYLIKTENDKPFLEKMDYIGNE
jgi:hypothetical protein